MSTDLQNRVLVEGPLVNQFYPNGDFNGDFLIQQLGLKEGLTKNAKNIVLVQGIDTHNQRILLDMQSYHKFGEAPRQVGGSITPNFFIDFQGESIGVLISGNYSSGFWYSTRNKRMQIPAEVNSVARLVLPNKTILYQDTELETMGRYL
jgi:hypothetical protein